MGPAIRMHDCEYDRSADHGAQWQELELIFGRLLEHGNMCKRREGSSVCVTYTHGNVHGLRPTEAACFRVRKCANNHQLIVASFQMFLRQASAAHFCIE